MKYYKFIAVKESYHDKTYLFQYEGKHYDMINFFGTVYVSTIGYYNTKLYQYV